MTVWLITTRTHKNDSISGSPAKHYVGRWNTPRRAALYTAESKSLAIVEMKLQDPALRADYVLYAVRIPLSVSICTISESSLPADWRASGMRKSIQIKGRDWIECLTSAVLKVPSTVIPGEFNYVINPDHPEFSAIQIDKTPITDLAILVKPIDIMAQQCSAGYPEPAN